MLDIRVTHYHHDICAVGEFINESCEFLVLDDHRLELEVGLDARELELLDDVRYLFETMNIVMAFGIMMTDDKESASFKQDYFISIDSHTELLEVSLEGFYIWQKEVDNLRPCFIECFIPDTCLEAINLKSLGLFDNLKSLFLERLLSL